MGSTSAPMNSNRTRRGLWGGLDMLDDRLSALLVGLESLLSEETEDLVSSIDRVLLLGHVGSENAGAGGSHWSGASPCKLCCSLVPSMPSSWPFPMPGEPISGSSVDCEMPDSGPRGPARVGLGSIGELSSSGR